MALPYWIICWIQTLGGWARSCGVYLELSNFLEVKYSFSYPSKASDPRSPKHFVSIDDHCSRLTFRTFLASKLNDPPYGRAAAQAWLDRSCDVLGIRNVCKFVEQIRPCIDIAIHYVAASRNEGIWSMYVCDIRVENSDILWAQHLLR